MMKIFVVQLARFIIRTVLVASLTRVCLNLRMAQAQELTAHDPSAAENESAAEASKQAANPLANLWLLQIQQNNNWVGMPANKGNSVQSNLQFQPLMSVKVNDDWNLITRPVIQTLISTPFLNQASQEKRVTAFGDTVLAFALSPNRNLVGNWLLAAGPSFIFPTATNSLLGQKTWQVGPAAAVGYQGKNFITYVFPQQWFSVGGDGRKTSHMLLYYAFVHVYSNGWSVGTNPNMSMDWEASRGNKLAFPVGLQVGKLRKLGTIAREVRRAGAILRCASTNLWAEMEPSAPNNADPPLFNRAQLTLKGSDMIITLLIAKIILGGYWLIFAPVLLLPLGTLLLSSQLQRGALGHAVLLISVLFAAAGVTLLFTLPFADAITALAGVLAVWCLAAAITHLARKGGERGRQPQKLHTAKASITR